MITFNNIVERFKIFAENHFFIETFSFGSPDDVDLTKFTSFPLMHLVYTGATYDPGTKTYNLEIYILDVPADKTAKVDRQKEVVSDAEQCAEDIIADIKNGGNIFLFAQDYEVVNATTTPLEEETKNVLSGVLLDLSVSIPYEWDACNAPIDGVEPGGTEVTYARRGVLRMLTLDGATDVPSVRTIKVTNGTLTDDGDGVVTLDTGGVDTLAGLTDVDVTGVTNGQVIAYNNGVWENADDAGGAESLNDLTDVNITLPEARNVLMYDGEEWVEDNVSKSDVGLGNVDNTSDADKPVSSATQTALNAKADTSAVPTELNDLSDVTITGTPTGNQALIYDGTAGAFKSLPNFTNRFEDEAEINKQGITPFAERVYTVKADGDGIFIDPEPDTPTAGKVIVRKIYHKAGFLESGAVIGDFTLIHTFADDTAYSATTSTFEGFRDGDTYGTPPFTLIQTWEEQTAAPSFTGLLNESYGSGASAAYSTRRLNGNVTECMVIRRASDSTTQTIGFVDGDIDESAIETFCTGTTCTVYQWLDQSGNGNTATAPSTGAEPTIYTGGALVKENGKVALVNGYFAISNAPITAAPISLAMVAVHTDGTNKNMWNANEQGTNTNYFYTRSDANNTFDAAIYGGGFVRSRADVDAGQFLGFAEFLTSGSNVTAQSFVDGGTGSTLVSTTPPTGIDVNDIGQFQRASTATYDCNNMQELVIWNSDKSSNRSDIESNIGDYFTQNTPLLDTYTGAAAAYSLRLLDSTYTGALINVWNGTSYADIYPNVFGELDTVALAAHCGSNDGFIRYWYDQSSNSNDATQTTTANMPKIYDGTTGVVTRNGKPFVMFSTDLGGLPHFRTNHSFTTSANDEIIISVVYEATTTREEIFQLGAIGMTANHLASEIMDFNGANCRLLAQPTQGTALSHVLMFADGTDIKGRANGAAYATDASDPISGETSGVQTSTTQVEIGRVGNNFCNESYIAEFVLYPSYSAIETGLESNINTFYDIYS